MLLRVSVLRAQAKCCASAHVSLPSLGDQRLTGANLNLHRPMRTSLEVPRSDHISPPRNRTANTGLRAASSQIIPRLPLALAIFLSAFLLFQVQLLLGKEILPLFGGSPAVWPACLLVFQLLLLGRYSYAHRIPAALSLPP